MKRVWFLLQLIVTIILDTNVHYSAGQNTNDDNSIMNLTCSQRLDQLDLSDDHSYTVQCPTSCDIRYCYIVGTTYYTSRSSVCCAGIHNGKITDSIRIMIVNVFNRRRSDYASTTKNGIKSYSYHSLWQNYFTLTGISPPTTTPTQTSTFKTTQVIITPPPVTNHGILSIISSSITNSHPETSTSTTTKQETNQQSTSQSTNPPEKPASSTIKLTNATKKLASIMEGTHIDTIETVNISDERNILSKEQLIIISTTCGLVLVIIVFITVIWRRIRSSPRWRFQRTRRSRDDACVCYVGVDSSVQGLLNDPETCERPCHVREFLHRTEDTSSCAGQRGPECGDCTGEKCSSFDF